MVIHSCSFLILQCIMFQNGSTYFKNLAEFAARFLKCVKPFWDIMYKRVKLITSVEMNDT